MASESETGQPRGYKAYLLRLWQVESDGRLVWRASLDDVHTGARLGFADLAQLAAFLNKRVGTDFKELVGKEN